MRMDKDRFKEYSESEAEQISITDLDSIKRVEAAPALLMYELQKSDPGGSVVRIGRLRDIRVSPSDILFAFDEEGRLTSAVIQEFADRLRIGKWELNRTHWAIKDGGIPSDLLSRIKPTPAKYDVVLSFAGEDRTYVEEVASGVRAAGLSVFYDEFEQVSLWGKDLLEHFDSVYRNDGRYCVMFISKAYGESMWTRHERRSALARGLESNREYVLPARFDDSEILGVRPTTGYLDLRRLSPAE